MSSLSVLADWDMEPDEQAALDRWPSDIRVIIGGSALSDEERIAAAAEIDVLAGRMACVRPAVLDAARRLRLVQMTGHGVDGLLRDDIPSTLRSRGIRLATADASDVPIAEFAMMAMTVLARNILPVHAALAQRGAWEKKRGRELAGATLCLVGFGAIGRAVALRARAFDMAVEIVTRNPAAHANETGLAAVHDYDGIEEPLGRADFVVLAAPLTARTRGLLDARRFAALRRGAYLVNVGRGPLVDERAFYTALTDGTLAGAAIDPWWCEEAGRKDGYPASEAIHQHNVLMTPHFSASTWETRVRVIDRIGENLVRLRDDLPLLNLVPVDVLEDMGAR